MIQCVMCEDWFHGRHLGLEGDEKPPKGNQYSEMICRGCAEKFRFLRNYADLAVNTRKEERRAEAEIDVETPPSKKARVSCPLDGVEKDDSLVIGTLFMTGEWRKNLCKCDKCLEMYKEKKVEFLLDDEDTVHHYEAKSKDSAEKSYEEGMKALSEMDRVKQVEAIQSYNAMKTDLMDFLKGFADSKKVVKPEDISNFFQQMKNKSKPKVEIPKFCR